MRNADAFARVAAPHSIVQTASPPPKYLHMVCVRSRHRVGMAVGES